MTCVLGILSGCGSVRFMATKCPLPDGSTFTMESKSSSDSGDNNSCDLALSLPNGYYFDRISGQKKIIVMSAGKSSATFDVADSQNWHLGKTSPVTKSFYVMGDRIFARVDFVEPDRLSLLFTEKNMFSDGADRPPSSVVRIGDDAIGISIGGLVLNSNWSQNEIIENNKIAPFSRHEGSFSIPGRSELEVRTKRSVK